MIQLSIGRIQSIELVTEDGERHDITVLGREDYEKFLSRMAVLKLAYEVLISAQDARTGAGRGDLDHTKE